MTTTIFLFDQQSSCSCVLFPF